jgi:hypothetical protein
MKLQAGEIMSELTKNDIPILIEAAKIACGYLWR